jgi:predicted small lipoprotein YifL
MIAGIGAGEFSLVRNRLNTALVMAVLGAAACALAACGRVGPLEPPPGPALAPPGPSAQAPLMAPSPTVGGPVATGPTAQETAQKNGFDQYGNPIAPPGQQKSFFLDFLLQ